MDRGNRTQDGATAQEVIGTVGGLSTLRPLPRNSSGSVC